MSLHWKTLRQHDKEQQDYQRSARQKQTETVSTTGADDDHYYKKLRYRRDSAGRRSLRSVQGHRRSPILVPLAESPYAISY